MPETKHPVASPAAGPSGHGSAAAHAGHPAPALPTHTPEDETRQRYKINVPRPSTTLLLGHRESGSHPPLEAPAFGYSGASLSTAEDFFVNVGQRTLFQGHDVVTFQSVKRIDVNSRGPLVLASLGGTASADDHATESTHGTAAPIKDTAFTNDLVEFFKKQAIIENSFQVAAEVISLARTMLGVSGPGFTTVVKSILGKAVTGVLGAKSVVTDVKGIVDGATGTAASVLSGGVLIASEESLSLVSAGSEHHYSGGGFSFNGGVGAEKPSAPTGVGGAVSDVTSFIPAGFTVNVPMSVNLSAGMGVSIYGNNSAAMESLGTADVTARKAVTLQSLGSTATLMGKQVAIG